MVFISLSNEIFIFNGMNIVDIGREICRLIDKNLLLPEDMEKFVTDTYFNKPPSAFLELYSFVCK